MSQTQMVSSVFSDIDEYGFKRPEDFDYSGYEKFMSSYYTVLSNRSRKWFRLTKDKKNLKKSSILKRYVRKGIPASYRSQVWVMISGVEELKLKYGPDLYQKLLNVQLDPDIIQSIRMDLPRTYPDNIFFVTSEGCQLQLYRVLHAYAVDNKDDGYCQGLNYITGLLLIITKSENTTFWLLKSLVQSILPEYYTRNMRGLISDIEVFSEIIRWKIPDLHNHMMTLNIPWSLLISKWFICLYAEVLPIETVLRIWDCLFYDGGKVLFRVGLTLVNHYRKQLLNCDSFLTFTDCFKNIPRDTFALDCHDFMKRVNKDNNFITNGMIKKLRKQVSKVNSASV